MTRRSVWWCVAGLLAIQTALLSYSAKVHSPTWEEVGHLGAGISHWQLGRFELYSVNPPLVRTIAAAPVALLSKPKVEWDYYRSDPSLRSEVFVGRHLIELNGADSFRHFFYARLAVLPIALLGGLLCFLWGRDLFGPVAGLLAMTLWTFSPNVLAYGSVITPDLAAAVALLGSSYLFWRWLKEPTWAWGTALSATLALAMLTKSVWLILPPLFVMIWAVVALVGRTKTGAEQSGEPLYRRFASWLRGARGKQAIQLVAASLIALTITNAFYGFDRSLQPLGQYTFVSSTFSGNAPQKRSTMSIFSGGGDQPHFVAEKGNRFSGWLAAVPVPLPANYLQGIDVQIRDFERGAYDSHWQSYLMGQWQQGGWWYYYIVALFVKVPLVTWLLVGAGAIAALLWRPEKDVLWGVVCLWVPAIVFFFIVSVFTGLNRYVRYAIPVLPILFIWASQVGRLVESGQHRGRRFGRVTLAAACLWLAAIAIWNTPHHLGYFNEVAGGSRGGHRVLCDCNVDWGQDLGYLKSWLDEHEEAKDDLRLAYFGSLDPSAVGISYRLPQDFQHPSQRHQLKPGWYVISKNYLVGHRMPMPDGSGAIHFRRMNPESFRQFQKLDPVDSIGSGLLVYRIEPAEAERKPMPAPQQTNNLAQTDISGI